MWSDEKFCIVHLVCTKVVIIRPTPTVTGLMLHRGQSACGARGRLDGHAHGDAERLNMGGGVMAALVSTLASAHLHGY